MTRRITVDITHAGQPSAYADSVYEGTIFLEWKGFKNEGDFVPNDIDAAYAKDAYAYLIHPWVNEPEGYWASPRLKYFEKIGPGLYKGKVILPYTD